MIDNCLLTFLLAAQISVVPPAEIERARTKYEEIWRAWQGIRLEKDIAKRKPKEVIADIQVSARHAEHYFQAKLDYYSKLRLLVQTQVRILGESSLPASMDTATLRTTIETQVESLERKEKALRERLLALNALPELSAEQRFEKDWIERQSVDQSKLRESLLAQREVLLKAAQTTSLHASARQELLLCIEQLAQQIDIISGDIAVERSQWREYHEALREWVVSGRKP